jgi:hypothetical protein
VWLTPDTDLRAGPEWLWVTEKKGGRRCCVGSVEERGMGLTSVARTRIWNWKLISNCTKFGLLQMLSSIAQKNWNKILGDRIWNEEQLCFWNLFWIEMESELKFREAKNGAKTFLDLFKMFRILRNLWNLVKRFPFTPKTMLKLSWIYLKCLGFSEIYETWSKDFPLHLVSFKIISKGFLV